MKYADFTQEMLISKIEELEKEISKKKEDLELTFEQTAVDDLLKKSESKLREAQAIAHIGHWNLDIVNNRLEWSDEIYRIFGIEPQEFKATYEDFLENIHPEDREMVSKAYSDSLETKKPYDIIHRLKLKDGTIKYVNEKCESFFDELGNAIYSLGTVQDITELKFAEEQLLRSEKRFEQLFEELGDAVYVTKVGGANKGSIIEVNAAAMQQTGYTRKELLNMNIIDDIHISGTGEISTDDWDEKLSSGESVTTTEKKRRKDGTEFWTEVIVTSIEFNGERASLSINHDITKRIQAEEKLKKSEEKYHGMIQNLGEGFYSATMDGKLLDYNPEFVKIVGLDPEKDHMGIMLPDFWQNPEERGAYLNDFIKNGFVHNFEINAKKIDGTKIVCQVSSLLIKDKQGKPLRMEGTFLDITERKLAETLIGKEIERTQLLLDLHSKAPKLSDKELYDFVLDKAVDLTDSQVGFFHQVDKDQNTIILTTWNQEALKGCDAAYDTHYSIEKAGNWVDCVNLKQPVIYNNFSKSPNQKGLPDSHFPLHRFMSIPVIEGDIVHYIFSVGNKETDYEEYDVVQIQLIANELYKIITQRKAVGEIRKLNEELEERVRERTEELSQEKYFSDAVINSLPGMFSLIGKDGNHIRWNKNHEEVTGYSTKEYKQMSAIDFFHKSEWGNILRTMSQIFETGKGDVEANLMTKGGKIIPYFFTGISIEINNKKYVAGLAIDITNLKHAEKELREKTEDLEAFNNVMIEREVRIIEMKEEVNKLSEQIGIEIPYPPVWKGSEQANE